MERMCPDGRSVARSLGDADEGPGWGLAGAADGELIGGG